MKKKANDRVMQMIEVATYVMRIVAVQDPDSTVCVFYNHPNDVSINGFAKMDCERFGIRAGEEYFLIYGNQSDRHILYAVNVTCDSVLTAASELMSLIAKKL